MKEKRDGRRRKFRDMIKLFHSEGAKKKAEPGPPSAQPGIIRFETGKLPKDFAEYRGGGESNRPGNIVIVIVALALAFIALIAWFIAHEPPK